MFPQLLFEPLAYQLARAVRAVVQSWSRNCAQKAETVRQFEFEQQKVQGTWNHYYRCQLVIYLRVIWLPSLFGTVLIVLRVLEVAVFINFIIYLLPGDRPV